MLLPPNPDRHWGCRISDEWSFKGLRTLVLQNELLKITVLVDKGSDIFEFVYKPLDIDFMWKHPNGLRAPSEIAPKGLDKGMAFHDLFAGGWPEILPNGCAPCEYKGAQLNFFGEVSNVPWHYDIVQDSSELVSVKMWVRTTRTPFLLEKTLTLNESSPALFIEERVTNLGAERMEFMWGHHPVIGPPFLDASCRINAPASKVVVLHDEDGPDVRMKLHQTGKWPFIRDIRDQPLDLRVVPGAESKSMDNCYLMDFEEGWIAVTNASQQLGFGLGWDAHVFKYIWLWEALGGGIGYPWYGRTFQVGIEPWTSWPCVSLAEAVARGTAASLGAGESVTAWLTAVAYTGSEEVIGIERDGSVRRNS